MNEVSTEQMYGQIAPIVASMRARMRSVPAAFADEDGFVDAVVAWAEDLANMLVEPRAAVLALEDLARVSPFFPSFADVMAKIAGPDWASEKLLFDVPFLLEEEVIDLSTGKTIERYPCATPGVRAMTRMELRRSGPPDYETELAKLKAEHPGLETARRPNVWGRTEAQAEPVPPEAPRPDLQDQISRLRGAVGE